MHEATVRERGPDERVKARLHTTDLALVTREDVGGAMHALSCNYNFAIDGAAGWWVPAAWANALEHRADPRIRKPVRTRTAGTPYALWRGEVPREMAQLYPTGGRGPDGPELRIAGSGGERTIWLIEPDGALRKAWGLRHDTAMLTLWVDGDWPYVRGSERTAEYMAWLYQVTGHVPA